MLQHHVLSCLVSYRNLEKLQTALKMQRAMRVDASTSLDLVVYDNSTDSEIAQKLRGICDLYEADLVVLPENLGVSGAYALAAQRVLEAKYDYLWLWDQDSLPPENCLNELLITFSNETAKAEIFKSLTQGRYPWKRLGVALPMLFDPTLEDQHWIFYGPPYELGKMVSHRFPMDAIEFGEASTTFMVNSGALVARWVLAEVGAPDPNFFMDFVDFEYSSRLAVAGVRMVVNSRTIVKHSVGQPQRKQLLGKTIWARNYPAFRYYYQAKNEVLLAHKSQRKLRTYWSCYFRLFIRPIKIYFDDQNVGLKMLAHYIGWFDGIMKKNGNTHAKWMVRVQ